MRSWKEKPVRIENDRLFLRPLGWTDAERVLGWINNKEIVSNFQFFTSKFTIEEEIRYILMMTDSPSDLLLGVVTKDGELIGTCGLHEIDFKNDTARLGVIIGKKEHWNKGYAGEAIRTLIDWAFSVMNLHKIYLNVFVTNKKSVHLYNEIGFQKEGKLRAEYKIRGEYVSMFRMSILKEDWKGGKNDDKGSD